MMADDYIKREDAITALENLTKPYYKSKLVYDRTICAGINTALREVQRVPAADVRPVKHGKWLKRDDMPRIVECKCSICGYAEYPSKNDRYWFERNYCPNCGAKMEAQDV